MSKTSFKQYAAAIYGLAKRDNVQDQIIADLETVDNEFKKSPSFFRHLEYPRLSLAEKENDLKNIFSDFISKRTYKIILLLIKNKHLGWLNKIIKELSKIKKTDEQILDANIYTPYNLEETQIAKLKSILSNKTGKTIIIHEIIDKNLIGGIKINLNGLIIDGSIQGEIERLKKNISTSLG